MSTETVSALLGWSSIINSVLLLLAAFFVIVLRDNITRLHASMFNVDEKELGLAYFQYLGQYKIAILMLNIVPWLALQLI